jgi:hypothetical protein
VPKGILWSELLDDAAFNSSLWRTAERKRRIFGFTQMIGRSMKQAATDAAEMTVR